MPFRRESAPPISYPTIAGTLRFFSGKSAARRHRAVLAYWKFESISLQERVSELQFLGGAEAGR